MCSMTQFLVAPTGAPTLPPELPPGQMDGDGYLGYYAPPSPGQSDDCGGAGYTCPTFNPRPPLHGHGPITQKPVSTPSTLPVTGAGSQYAVYGAALLLTGLVFVALWVGLRRKGAHRR